MRIKKILDAGFRKGKRLGQLLIYFIPALILRLFRIRVLDINYTRIGHLVCDSFCTIREQQLYSLKYKYVMIGDREKYCNKSVIPYLRKYFTIIDGSVASYLLSPLTKHFLVRKNLSEFTAKISAASFISIVKRSENFPPLFDLTMEDIAKGRELLAEMGIPENAWYVCIHNRESGYSGGHGKDWNQEYRNCSIESFDLAADAIIAFGGYCIRMGDPSMAPAAERNGYIDYANSKFRSEFLDVFLSASCKFYIGNSSGLFCLGSMFNVPAVCTNMVPLGAVLPWGSKEIGIPKLYIENEKPQSFGRILNSESGNYRFSYQYRDAGIVLEENSKDDILQATLEMYERLENPDNFYSADDEALQKKFKNLMNETNYTFDSSSRIGRDFLRKYQYLLN